MAVLRDIPIQQLTIPVPQTEARIDLPDSNLSGQWSRVQITLTNNYVDETYPLTNQDVIMEMHLTLTKGAATIMEVYTPVYGGQFIHALSGLPIKRQIYINRPHKASGDPVSGTVKVGGYLIIYTPLEIGATAEYF